MSKKILLVEDEAFIAMAESKMLEKHGFSVITAYRGEKAIEIVDTDPNISLVLMDIDLGNGMDGTEAAKRILEKHNMPIVFLSSHSEPKVVEKTEGITSYGYIVKNSGETVLRASIKMAFRLFEANNRIARSEEKHRLLFETMTPGVVYHAADGSIISANPASEKLLGLTFEQMQGKTPMDPRWKMITEEGESVPGSEHPVMTALSTGEKVGPVTRGVFIPEKETYVWLLISAFSPQKGQFAVVFYDITEQKMVEENLRITLNSIGDAVIATDSRGYVTRMNPVAEELCGWKKESALGKSLEEVFHIVNAYTGTRIENPVSRVMDKGEVVGLANHTMLISKEGKEYQIADSAAPIKNDDGEIRGVVLIFRDVTSQYAKSQNLQESEEKYKKLAESVGAILWEYDINKDRWTYVAPQVQELLGYSPSEWTDLKFWTDKIHSEDRNWATSYCNKCTEEGRDHRFEYRFVTKSGDSVWLRDDVTVELEHNHPTKLRGFMVDISNRKNAEVELKKTLQEKDFLMKELNHRVKNSINMISSLISLKESETENELSDLKHRIDAIGLVHENLHQTDEVDRINVKTYLQKLLETIFSSFTNRDVHILINIEEVSIPTKTAIPLGLIVNEIATNAIKYGFTPYEEARFTVSLKVHPGQGHYVLSLSNTGNPFPEEIDFKRTDSLGLRLVTSLSEQINGSVELQKTPYPEFTITFPNSPRT